MESSQTFERIDRFILASSILSSPAFWLRLVAIVLVVASGWAMPTGGLHAAFQQAAEDGNEPDEGLAEQEGVAPVASVEFPQLFGQRENAFKGGFTKPYLIEIDAPIDGFFSWYLQKSLLQAQQAGADVVIIQLTTPGGELDTTLDLADQLLAIDWAKVVVWIPKQAFSGGAILSLAADVVSLKSTASFGDAGPVFLTPMGDMIQAEEKIVSATAQAIRTLAGQSNRPKEIAAAMADRKLKVWSATHLESGKQAFLNQTHIDTPEIADQFKIGAPIEEAGNDRFLTVDGSRAVQLWLGDATFESETEMIKAFTAATPIRISVNWRDNLVYTMNRPWFTAIILLVGAICLYIEFTAPGVSLPGLIAMLCFAAFFWSHILGGTAGGLEIMMFVVGCVCLLLELFLFPGFGVFGIAGLGLIGISLLMATQDFLIPQSAEQWKLFEQNALSVMLGGVVVAALIAVQIFWFDSIPGFKRFQLNPETIAPTEPTAAVVSAFADLNVGDRGVAHSDLRPSGKARFGESIVDVLSDGDFVERQSQVSILRIEGNVITVRRILE